jgi:protein-L-isoaspartate O-methyltransferase
MENLKRLLILAATLFLSLFIFINDSYARYCNNPYCAMCNRIFGYMPGYGPSGKIVDTFDKEFTPQKVVEAMLKIVEPKPTDLICDLGCGDGRILITSVQQYKCRAVGIEIDPTTAQTARSKVKAAGLNIPIYQGDIKDHQRMIASADILTMYLYPDSMPKNLMSIVKPNTKVISLEHKIPNVDNLEIKTVVAGKKYTFYMWTAPLYNFFPVSN